jgi:hypothetical protein
MNFHHNQPRSPPIVRVARLGGPELVLLLSSRHTSAFVVRLIDTAAVIPVLLQAVEGIKTEQPPIRAAGQVVDGVALIRPVAVPWMRAYKFIYEFGQRRSGRFQPLSRVAPRSAFFEPINRKTPV